MAASDVIMEMSYQEEFVTVDLILSSSASTRGVDAFALSLIKAEKQLRKLFTHLVFQFPCFNTQDIDQLRETLVKNKKVYLGGFEEGIDSLFTCTVKDLVGEDYAQLKARIDDATNYRNKIFHGQLTDFYLNRGELLSLVADIQRWCKLLSGGATTHIGYDGFSRNSFQKSKIDGLSQRFKIQFNNLNDYEKFIEAMERKY